MVIGASTASFYPVQTEQALCELGKRGVTHAEVFLNTYSEVAADFIRDLRKTADFYNMKIHSVHPFTCAFEPFLLFTGYERRFADGLEIYKGYFEAMNLLGADIFVFHGDRFGSAMPDEQYFERFARLRDLGKRFGITVAQENVERCKSKKLDFLVSMASYLDNDLALVFDNKQAVRSNVSYEEFIEKLHRYIVHVHISDNSPQNDCMAIGEGVLDTEHFLRLLAQSGFDGCCAVELYRNTICSEEQIFSSCSILEKQLLSLNKL